MNPCCLLLLLSLATEPVEPTVTPELWPSLGSLVQPESATPAPLALTPLPLYQSRTQRGGIIAPQRPHFFISAGFHAVEGEHFYDDEGDDEALSFDLGYMTWNGDMGFAIEAGYMRSSFETDFSLFQRDEVDTSRYLLGIRFIDAPAASHFAPYLRGGLLYREDKGDLINDDGAGWYLGGGIDMKLGQSGFRIAPQALYSETDSLNTTEWLIGVTATLAF